MLHRAAAAAVACLFAGLGPVQAQDHPFQVGASLSINHDSNLFRLPDGATPASVRSRADTLTSASLLGGADLHFGRQRLRGQANVSENRFSNNDQLNNRSHGAKLMLDWETIGRLSGRLGASSNRSLRKFDPAEAGGGLERNIETVEQAEALARLGGVTRLTFEGGVTGRRVDYSSPRYRARAYRQDTGSLGLRWRPGGATTLGIGLRRTDGRYPNTGDRFEREDIDLFVTWVPSGLTTLDARLSRGRIVYERFTERNFTGFNGALKAIWAPTGKLKFTLRAARDTGQDSNFITFADELVIGTTDFSRTTNSLRFDAAYALSAKISVSAGLVHLRRSLVGRRDDVFGSDVTHGSDRTTLATLGLRWAPWRSVLLGCDVNHDQRRAAGIGSSPYKADGFGCFGQWLLP